MTIVLQPASRFEARRVGGRSSSTTSLSIACLAVAVLSSGCASLTPPRPVTTPPSASDIVKLSGRLAVRVEGESPRSVSAVFDLQGTPASGELGLSTPLGSMLAQARWQGGSVTLRTPRGETSYANLDAMTREVMGESIPVAALFDWLQARPWPQAPSRALAAPARGFEQLGWTVDLGGFDNGQVEARRSTAPPVTVKVRLD